MFIHTFCLYMVAWKELICVQTTCLAECDALLVSKYESQTGVLKSANFLCYLIISFVLGIRYSTCHVHAHQRGWLRIKFCTPNALV